MSKFVLEDSDIGKVVYVRLHDGDHFLGTITEVHDDDGDKTTVTISQI